MWCHFPFHLIYTSHQVDAQNGSSIWVFIFFVAFEDMILLSSLNCENSRSFESLFNTVTLRCSSIRNNVNRDYSDFNKQTLVAKD